MALEAAFSSGLAEYGSVGPAETLSHFRERGNPEPSSGATGFSLSREFWRLDVLVRMNS